MPSYIVTWEIDADEIPNPRAAAVYARAAQIRPGTWATVFDVKDKATGETTRVDLDEDEDEDDDTAGGIPLGLNATTQKPKRNSP